MSVSIIRAAALAFLAGVASTPALAQDSDAELQILLQQQLQNPVTDDSLPEGVTPLPEGEVPVDRKKRQPQMAEPESAIDGITPLPEGEQPIVRKRRQQVAEPVPEIEGVTPLPEGEQPIVRRKPRPEVVEPGPEDEEEPPRRRRPRNESVEPGPGPDFAGPSADQIERQLDARPRIRLAPSERVTIREFQRRPDLRRAAPSIEIQAINFATGSAEIPISQYRKVENIAIALDRLLRRDPDTLVLIEGHTDAVGSFGSNQALSERRAASLKRVLVREFDMPRDALETVGYGEEYLLIPTTRDNWKNRRVTLRVIDDFVR
jgi:outer membrane protein OmpA-like peptidoglycan-associated protein